MLHLLMLFMLADPFVGTWKLRPDKGKAAQGYESLVVTVTATATGHKWSYDFVLKSSPKHMKITILTDRKAGKFKMLSEDGKPVSEGKLIIHGPTDWEVDSPNNKSRGSISPDGKTMTVVATEPAPATLLFDKQ